MSRRGGAAGFIPLSAVTLVKRLARRALPTPVWQGLATMARRRSRPAATAPSPSPLALYERPWETMGRLYGDDEVVGSGDFDLIGRIELGALLMEGLRPTDTLVDFGCGTGRLAVHVIPRLVGGHYIGIDIAQGMLDKARLRIERLIPRPPCRISWVKQGTTTFPLDDQSVDIMCAFSVFTHMEHEDAYRYLTDARRVVRPGGRFVFSCLPIHLRVARQVFLASAGHDLRERWSAARDVITSVDLMTAIVRLAGWEPLRWYDGDEGTIRLPDTGALHALGQSVCVLGSPGAQA